MAYKALYRTYRPSGFEQMAGQKHIVKTLENAIIQNKIAHAYLFCGPRGTGKTSSAKIFAKAINCEADSNKPCGVCPNCIAAQNGTHSDIIEIDAASNNGVEEARNLIEKVKYAPLLGKYKVYIIDEVHMMSTGAFNALLKTIEEPPAHVVFILATTEPQKVLPTIISRCQRFDFSKIGKSEIVKRLRHVTDKEGMDIEDKVLESIAILADGGMRDALSILDQCRAYSPVKITLEDVNEIYGVVSVQEICDLFASAKKQDTEALIHAIEKFDKSGTDIKRLTTDLIEILKESVVYDYSESEELLEMLTLEQVRNIKKDIPVSKRLEMIDVLMDTFERYKLVSNVVSYFEIGMLKLMNLMNQKIETVEIKKEKVSIQPQPKKIEIQTENIFEFKPEIRKEDTDDTISSTMESIIEPINEIEETNNVSRETLEPIKKEVKSLDMEFILRLLTGANKPEKNLDNEKMKDLTSYLLDFEVAKYAHLLKNSTIVASGETYMIICVDSEIKANEINDLDKNSEFIKFTQKLLQKGKKVFALTVEQRNEVIDMFKQRHANGTLPEPYSFEIKEEVKKEEDEQIKNLKMLFNEIEIRED